MTTKTATLRDSTNLNNVVKKLSDEQELRLEQFALETLLDVAANSKLDAIRVSAAKVLLEWRFSKNIRDGVNKVQTEEEKMKDFEKLMKESREPLMALLRTSSPTAVARLDEALKSDWASSGDGCDTTGGWT